MAIAIALLGFNDLGRSVTPTLLFRNRFYLQLSPHCPKINKKSMSEAGAGENTQRRLAGFVYLDHPTKNDVTSGKKVS